MYKIYGHGELTKDSNLPTLVTTSCGACDGESVGTQQRNSNFIQPHLEYNHNGVAALGYEIITVGFSQLRHACCCTWNHEEGLHVCPRILAATMLLTSRLVRTNIRIDLSKQFLLLSGRCGWDIVAKAAVQASAQ